jgi:hypothetical protein
MASQPSDGGFDAAFLPGRAWVAEVGFGTELPFDVLVPGKFRTLVESVRARGATAGDIELQRFAEHRSSNDNWR